MRLKFLALAGAMVITIVSVPKATAQIPLLPNLTNPNSVNNNGDNSTVYEWIYLDGRPILEITAAKNDVSQRLVNIQGNLQGISQEYFQSTSAKPQVEIRTSNDLPVIYVNNKYLMTVTSLDAQSRDVDPVTLANEIAADLQIELEKSKAERQTSSLMNQGKIAGGITLVMILSSALIYRYQRRSQPEEVETISIKDEREQAITTLLNQQQHEHLAEVKKRLFQLTQTGIWSGGIFLILGLFPYTRVLQIAILAIAQIPVKVGIVILGTYVVIRFSYALIDKLTSTLIIGGFLLNSETSARMRLRVSTFSGVTKSITTMICMGLGILITLTSVGINVVPLLAGAGLIGVVISLASQNLIKDAVNGFLIILEDQYALGDVIIVGNVDGLVEKLNLRMTQVRDGEGRLITIPNSEIKVVANLSSRWSRADLTIPVPYQSDIDEVLKLIENVAVTMNQESEWKRQIIEKPSILGIDNFGDRGMMIRVWIKTQPLKQWDVAREYRRRLKIAFDQAGINIPVPQQSVWVNDAQYLTSAKNPSTSNFSGINHQD